MCTKRQEKFIAKNLEQIELCKIVLRLVIGHGAKMALIGVTVGTGAALGLTRLMSNQLLASARMIQ